MKLAVWFDRSVHLEIPDFVEDRVAFPVYRRSASLRHADMQTYRPSAPSGADLSARVPLPLSLQRVMNWSVGCSIGNNNRNCKLRILPGCHVGI